MALFERLKKHSGHLATATIANIATGRPKNDAPVAKIAKFAVATPPSEKTEIPPKEEVHPEPLPAQVDWESPLFGKLSGGPVLEMTETTFSLIHPLTGEKVTLSREWLISMEERSAIIEHDGGLAREGADKQARIEFFGLFKKGEEHA